MHLFHAYRPSNPLGRRAPPVLGSRQTTRPEESAMDARTPQPGEVTDRNLALELVRVTEAAALAASALDRPRQEERGRRRRGGSHAQGLRPGRHRRHRRHRRGRDGRGPDALHRREGRLRRPADGHRGRSAGRHHAHRQGRPQRARRRGAGRARQLPARARHLHGQDRRRRRAAGRRGRPRRARSARTCATSPGPSTARSPTWWPASSIATATRN